MKTEITLKQKIDIRPAMAGVIIKNITEDYNDIKIEIEIEFNTEFYDFISSKDSSYEIKNIRAKGKCIVIIDKNDFIKNGYLAKEKEIIDHKLYEELPLEYKDMILNEVTCFTYKFI